MTRQQGFTLVEILVAFMVLVLVGGALLQLFQGGMRNLDSSRHYTQAALLARSKLTELSVAPHLAAGEQSGRFDDTYRWTLTLTPYQETIDPPIPETHLLPLKADLTINWQPDGEYRVSTLLLSHEDKQ